MEYKYSKHSNSKIGPKEAKFICENYPNMSSVDLGIKYKVQYGAILSLLRKNNIKINKSIAQPKINLKMINYCKKLKKDRMKLCMKKFNISKSTFMKLLKVAKIKTKKQITFNYFKKNKNRIEQDYKKYSIIALSKKYKLSPKYIRICFKTFNIKMRSASENSTKFLFKGKKYINKGYVIMTIPLKDRHLATYKTHNRVAEHRLVMAKYLGRPLAKHENVHHINGRRDDNRLENLELWSRSQPSGQRVQDKIKWAKELLKQYKNFKR